MSIRLVLFLLLSLALFGCSSTQEQEGEAEVVDQGTGVEGEGTTYGAEDAQPSGLAELDDPNSPLYVRVIYFEYDSSEIQAQYRPTVEAHAAFLARNPGISVTLEGHADERGSREYNLALGERRAESVKQQMIVLGATASQIRVVSYGEERPAVDGHDEASWGQNRRVEFVYR